MLPRDSVHSLSFKESHKTAHSAFQIIFTQTKKKSYHILPCTGSNPIFLLYIPYKKASASELTTLRPTTNQPVCCTCLLVIMLAVSQTKCLKPLNEW